MNQRTIGVPDARLFTVRFLALALASCAGVVMLPAGDADAADQKRSRDKMVELNKQALFFYQAKDWESAKDSLDQAIDIAEAAGLENNNMTARTYVHLGAVYWAGFHDREAANQNFSMAKKIRPDIQLTPMIETPDLKAAFAMASDKAVVALPVVPTPKRPAIRVPPISPKVAAADGEGANASTDSIQVAAADGEDEPALPATMSSPLMCTIPTVAAPNRELAFRCALQPGLTATLMQLHYRPRGYESYQVKRMQRTARGWYIATLPSDLMQLGSLQVYFDARDDADNLVASIGQPSSPSVIAVRERGSIGSSGREDDPLRRAREEARADRYEAGLHRRREGSLWLGLGAGMGWGYVPAGKLEWEKNVQVSAMTTQAGMFHLVPEIGTMVSDNFGLALQGRIEFIRQEQAMYADPATGAQVQLAGTLPGAPATVAPALFVRAIGYLDLSNRGNLRLSYSGDVGGGFIRFPVKPFASVSYQSETDTTVADWDKTIAKTDTRSVGMVLFGASVGLSWNLSRHFALAWNGRALSGVPSWGAVFESTLSAQLAFGGKSGQESLPDEEED
jgi:hypothetical protein